MTDDPKSAGDFETLLASMRAKAEEECAEILAAAEARAREIDAAADAETAAFEERAYRRLRARLEIEAERIRGAELGEERADRLTILRDALDEVRRRARERLLEQARGPAYAGALELLLKEAAAEVGEPGEAAVDAPEETRARIGKWWPGCRIVASDRGPGSVVVRSRDGRRSVDNSLGTRLDDLFSLDGSRIAALLVGEEAE